MEHHVTQRLSINVQNDLPKGNIVIKNTVITWYLRNITIQRLELN